MVDWRYIAISLIEPFGPQYEIEIRLNDCSRAGRVLLRPHRRNYNGADLRRSLWRQERDLDEALDCHCVRFGDDLSRCAAVLADCPQLA